MTWFIWNVFFGFIRTVWEEGLIKKVENLYEIWQINFTLSAIHRDQCNSRLWSYSKSIEVHKIKIVYHISWQLFENGHSVYANWMFLWWAAISSGFRGPSSWASLDRHRLVSTSPDLQSLLSCVLFFKTLTFLLYRICVFWTCLGILSIKAYDLIIDRQFKTLSIARDKISGERILQSHWIDRLSEKPPVLHQRNLFRSMTFVTHGHHSEF